MRVRRQKAGEPAVTAADLRLDAAESVVSVGVREIVCRLCCDSRSFRRCAENLARTAQVELSHDTARIIVENEGRAVLAAEAAGEVAVGWSAEDCAAPETGVLRVYLGVDGVKVPTVTDKEKKARRAKVKLRRRRCGKKRRPLPRLKPGTDQIWKEFKLVYFYDQTREHELLAITRGDHKAAGALMRRAACRINLSRADDAVGLFDGADWIRNQVRGQSLNLDAIGLDFYHLADYVHKCRRVLFGDSGVPDSPGMTWAAAVLHTVKHEGYEAFWDRLCATRSLVRGSRRKRAAVDDLMGYAAARREMIAYPEFAAAGRDIGSGPTEGKCKTSVARLKGSGMRWDPDNAEAVAALEALRDTRRWLGWWTLQVKRPA